MCNLGSIKIFVVSGCFVLGMEPRHGTLGLLHATKKFYHRVHSPLSIDPSLLFGSYLDA